MASRAGGLQQVESEKTATPFKYDPQQRCFRLNRVQVASEECVLGVIFEWKAIQVEDIQVQSEETAPAKLPRVPRRPRLLSRAQVVSDHTRRS